MSDPLRIATRGSALARWQAEHIAGRIRRELGRESTLVVIRTSGDRFVDRPLKEVGGKGLFVKEIEEALLAGEADLAVHSAKDLPGELPDELCLSAFPERADPRDAMVSEGGGPLSHLPEGAKVGTGSERRRCQLLAVRPDLELRPLRGNVDTRLRKLRETDLDAVVLACAGLDRLGFDDVISERISVDVMLPAAGQGSLAIETRRDDPLKDSLEKLNDANSEIRLRTERAFLAAIGGDCHVPVAAYAEVEAETIRLRALLGDPETGALLRIEKSGPSDRAFDLGSLAGQQLLDEGGRDLLAALRAPAP